MRGVTLPGYYKGIEFYIIPKWEQLKDVSVINPHLPSGPVHSLGVSGVRLRFCSISNRNSCKQTVKTLIRSRVLHCLSVSQKRDSRIIWVIEASFLFWRIRRVFTPTDIPHRDVLSRKAKCFLYFTIYEPWHDKTNNVAMRPAKIPISLGGCSGWAESSLGAWRKLGSLATHWAHSEDSDQTGRMLRLSWVFAGRILILLVLSCHSSFYNISSFIFIPALEFA